ncbi:glycosyltransferase family 1 protein [Alteribacillus sp. YIM 98480]|uniref:glycosyltransferase family 1 protein n=1 Tax=Alteribacillus sp. YIM 98480 TaxID=2606599 RepID=UPI00131D6FA7|nr:glycosyltransferase family 1 protein [Alteribacillus sp. YIM 98480]
MSKIKSTVIEPPLIQEPINPNEIGRVLHLPYNAAGQMSTQALALKKLGVNTSFCDYYQSKFQFPTDVASPIKNLPKKQREAAMLKFAKKNIAKYDIFHFHFGQSFTRYSYKDLPLLKAKKKKMVMNYWGTQVRRLSIAKKKNSFAIVKQPNEKLIVSRLNIISSYMDTAIVPDHELLEYVYGYFKKIYIIRASIDQTLFTPFYPNIHNKKPLVVHAPTHRNVKGTEYIIKAVQNLKKVIKFDFVLIENMTNDQALTWYKKADIVVDQLRLGIYGTVSIESMLFGKPVISFIREDLKYKYPPGLPVISATPHTIEKELYNLIKNPKLRYKLGVKGRKYATKHHHQDKIARQLVTVYKNL